MGNFLSNMGLVAQGMDEGALAQQRVQTGQIGLDELQRTTDQAKAYRQAISGADPNAGRIGIYDSVKAAALKSGDLDTHNKANQAAAAAQDEGMARLAKDALTGIAPDQAEKNWNSIGLQRIQSGSLEFGRDPQSGDIFAKAMKADGTPLPVFNASEYVRRQQKTVKLAPGETLVGEHGGPPLATNASDKHSLESNFKVIKDSDGNEKLIDLRTNTQVNFGGTSAGGINIVKHKAVLDDITKSVHETKGMGELDPTSGKIIPTAEGQKRATIAEQLYMSNPKIAPQTVRDIAINGKPVMNGAGERGMQYNGQVFMLNSPTGSPVSAQPAKPASAAPAAQPKPAAAPSPTPEPAPAAPVQAAPELLVITSALKEKYKTEQREMGEGKRMKWSPDVQQYANYLHSEEIKGQQGRREAAAKAETARVKNSGIARPYSQGGKVTRYQKHGL